MNGIFYVSKNGGVWRDLPCDFPPYPTVYWYHNKWIKDGTGENINQCFTADYREKQDKKVPPSVAIIDSQSPKNSATCTEEVGFDGGKKIKGRKRFFIVDTLGNLLDSVVCPANFHDGTTAFDCWDFLVLETPILAQVPTIFLEEHFANKWKKKEVFVLKSLVFPLLKKGRSKSMKNAGLSKELSLGLEIIADVPKIMSEKPITQEHFYSLQISEESLGKFNSNSF